MDEFKQQLAKECLYKMADETMNRFASMLEKRIMNPSEILVMSGNIDSNIYFVKDGIMRYSYMNGKDEITSYFAVPPTMMVSYHSYYHRQPSFYQIDACCRSTVLKITKTQFDNLIKESNDFAQWAYNMANNQLYYFEMKSSIINGDAKERLLSLIKNRPDIVARVSAGHIASYLQISQSYLSRLKKQLYDEKNIRF